MRAEQREPEQRELYLGPLAAATCTLMIGYLILQLMGEILGARVQKIELIHKYDQCFVVYEGDIEVIPCPK